MRLTRDAPAPMALFDAEGRYLAGSKSWEQITNITAKEYYGQPIEAVKAELPSHLAEQHRRAQTGEHFLSDEERYVDALGVERWLRCEYRPVMNPDNLPRAYYVHGHDLTPLMQARREAQANADRLRLAMGAARAGVSELDFAAKTMWCSPEFTQIVGIEVDFRRFAREPWYMAHPEDRVLIEKMVSAWTGPRHAPVDLRIVLPSGDIRWAEIHGEQQWDDKGRRTKIVGLILDIDARKRQELALADARREAQTNAERLSLAMKAARAGVFEVSFSKQEFWCSDEFVEIVGCALTFDEAASDDWPIIAPEDRERVTGIIREWMQVFTFKSLEARIVLPTGEHRWVHFSGDMQLTADGLPDKLACLVLDIDERKRQELALAEARHDLQTNAERLKLALDAARAGAFETNFKEQTFWCSPEFEDIVGGKMTFADSLGVWPMTHPDDVQLVQTAIDRSQALSQTVSNLEWRLLLPDGQVRWIDGRAIIHVDENGAPEKLAGLVLDIDERKQQELALIEAERAAQAAAEAKSQFLANMSHEIRTPMNGVLGVLHLLERENLSDEGRQLLGEASNCGRMLSQLLDDVIDFSRIEAGRLDLAPEAIDAANVVDSVVGLLRPSATAKGLELRTQVDAAHSWIMADPVRLRQALFNLIGNAVKFTSAGHVEVRLTITNAAGRARLRFEIEDTGVGIPEPVQASLFRRFQQADGSTSRRFGGSGLGLAITRRLAEMMDGEVGFASSEGAGSTFWLEIAADRAQAPVAAPEPAPMALTGARILLVEDNATNRLVATKMLEAMGVSVASAENGAEGVEAARQELYDLILMDVQMPVMDGVEATRRIRALNDDCACTPIIGLTANVMAHQKIAYLAAGMNGVVGKPISPAALLMEIARVLSETPGADTVAA